LVEREIKGAGGLEYVDPLRLMQEINRKFEDKGLEVPLRMHLAVKNVFALQELRRRTFGEERDTQGISQEGEQNPEQTGKRSTVLRRRFFRRKISN
jgi:hypothetical protein